MVAGGQADDVEDEPPALEESVESEQLAVTETVSGSQVGQVVGKTELVLMNEVEVTVGQLAEKEAYEVETKVGHLSDVHSLVMVLVPDEHVVERMEVVAVHEVTIGQVLTVH